MLKWAIGLYLVIGSVFAAACPAEFQVNIESTDDQASAAIAADPAGNFVVVWSSYRQDSNSGGIFGRLFDKYCQPASGEFQINTTTAGNQTRPAVAMDQTGNFVVVWQGPTAQGQNNNEAIFAQRFNSNGQLLGSEFCVSCEANSRLVYPRIAMSRQGRFICTWQKEWFCQPFYVRDVFARIYDAIAQPVGAEFKVNLLSNACYPDAGIDDVGNFTIAWMQQQSGYNPDNAVMFRQYNANGTARANPCQVNTTSFTSITKPSIAVNGNGHFLIVWDGNPQPAGMDNIYGRRFKFNGKAVTDQFTVNTVSSGAQQNPRAAMDNWRRFIIGWNGETIPDSNERDIFARRYDSTPSPLADEFRVNTYLVDDQKYPSVAMTDGGEFITVWQSNGQDGSGYGIFAQGGPPPASADFNGDYFIDFSDFRLLAEEWLKTGNGLKSDLVNDDTVDQQDLAAFLDQWLTPCYSCSQADIYSDGTINLRDYATFARDWLKKGPLISDITGDGIVNLADLKAILFHWAAACE